MNALPAVTRALVQSVRKDMKTRGYSLVDTSGFLGGKVWPSQRSDVFKKLNTSNTGHYISLSECSVDWTKRLTLWQDRLLREALPEENVIMKGNSLSLRNERFNTKKDGSGHWHIDGAYIRSICVLKGTTTNIMTHLGESSIPLGWTLFITAKERNKILEIPGTLHRRPRVKKLRRLIVNGWDRVLQ